MSHEDFMEVVKAMDVGMQASFSESFNIVSADFVAMGVPIAGSLDIEWLSSFCKADPNSIDDIKSAMKWAMRLNWLRPNDSGLRRHNRWAKSQWLEFID